VREAKASLGPIEHLDLTGYDLARAHFELGTDVAHRVGQFLGHKLGAMDPRLQADEIRRARGSLAAARRALGSSRISGAVRHAVGEYLRSLGAWADGAQLGGLAHQVLGGSKVDGAPVGPVDLAFVLQDEVNGCQTGMYREQAGSVILWHTEEDREYPGPSRFDKLRLVSFRGDGRDFTAFVYPDLLPGPAFGWSGSTYAHAVDAFYLQPPNGRSGMPANAATWICLYLAGAVSTAEVASALAPFIDGYALSSIRRDGGTVRGDTTEFVGAAVHSTSLAQRSGSSAFKVNILSAAAAHSAPGLEALQPERRTVLERRVARTTRALRALSNSCDPVADFSRLLSSRVGGEFAYANQSVRAHFLCRMTPEETSIWVGPGPAVAEGRIFAAAWSPG
jgi:hypothetical protein